MFWFRTAHPEIGETLEVEAVHIPHRRGARDCYGAPLEPDDVEEVQICEVRSVSDGELVDFTNFQEILEKLAWRHVAESIFFLENGVTGPRPTHSDRACGIGLLR